VNDARLVVLNAMDAAARGVELMVRTRVTSARREGELWIVTVQSVDHPEVTRSFRARMLINAAGPWVDQVLQGTLARNDVHNVRLVQGSHIVVRAKFADPRAFFFQNSDGRIIFAIPYEDDFTLIGTTDQDFKGDPKDIRITEGEIDYLCAAASEYFAEPVRREDIVWTYSGVRPLYDDGASKAQEATRDYVLKVEHGPDAPGNGAPMLNVFGGKITTYRRLAEAALEKIEAELGARGPAWTATATLPGGDFPATGFESEVARLRAEYGFLDDGFGRRLVRLYGTRARMILGSARSKADLGRDFGADLTESEIRYLVTHEWARTADDVLWRRTKRGLHLSEDQRAAVDDFMHSLPVTGIAAAE
jgi:glycerol-3-phosphate dehydrogenase